jgi:hypothetical protein
MLSIKQAKLLDFCRGGHSAIRRLVLHRSPKHVTAFRLDCFALKMQPASR